MTVLVQPSHGQVGQAPMSYSHAYKSLWVEDWSYSPNPDGANVAMGKDRYVAGSITSLLSGENYVLDSAFNLLFAYHSDPNVSTPTRQYSAISSTREVWYAGQFPSGIRISRMTEQGAILSQFQIPSYQLAGLYADTLGKVYCFVYLSNVGAGMLRFSSNGTLDFGSWVNGNLDTTAARSVRMETDGKFYFRNQGGLLAMDRNGNVGRMTTPPPGWLNGPIYPDGDRAIYRKVAGPRIQVVRMDSLMQPRWAVEFDVSPTLGLDSLVDQMDAVVVPHTQEIFLLATVYRNYFWSGMTCNFMFDQGVLKGYGIRPDGRLAMNQQYDSYLQKTLQVESLFNTPYGEPLAMTLDRHCIFGANSQKAPYFRQFSLTGESVECDPGVVNGFNWHTITVPAGTSNTLATASPFSPTVVPDVLGIIFHGNTTSKFNTCPKPCANLLGAQALGAGQMQFTDSIYGFNQVQYAFGDGTFGNVTDPIHAYPGPGNYPVVLIASNECGSDTATYLADPCRSATMSTAPIGCVGVATVFSQTSSYPSGNIEWLLNGVHAANGNTYSFTPSAVGTYQVSIVLHELPCRDTVSQAFVVNATTPVPAFALNAGSNNTVYFTNQTTGASSYSWDFGDGQTSTAQHPSHVYALSGSYTICLAATNSCGTATACSTWTCTFPVADYSYSINGATISLQSTATGATSIAWDFGDGNTATGNSVSHTYASSGTYSICQYASSGCAIDTFCQPIGMVTGGNVYWRRGYSGLSATVPRGNATNAIGQSVVVGGSAQGEFVLLLDSTGAKMGGFTLPSSPSYELHDACAMANGHFLIVGGTTAGGPAQMNGFWMEVDANGAILNQQVHGTTGTERFFEVTSALHGGYLLTGVAMGSGYVVKLDANLQVEWAHQDYWVSLATFQATDSSYWVVQRHGVNTINFTHLDKVTGQPFESWETYLSNTGNGGNITEAPVVMTCSGDIYVAASFYDNFTQGGTAKVLGLYKFNTQSHAGLAKVYIVSTNNNYPPVRDWAAMDMVLRPNGDLLLVGEMHPKGNPNASPFREQLIGNVTPSLGLTQYYLGQSQTQDRLAAVSLQPNGAFLSAGDVNGDLELRRFLNSSHCPGNNGAAAGNFMYYTSTLFLQLGVTQLPAWGSTYPSSAQPVPLPGASTLECHTTCSTFVTAGFTYTLNGNTLTLTSTSTPGAALSWSVPGQACLAGSPISFQVNPCATSIQVSLTAMNGCDNATATQTIALPGNLGNPTPAALVADTTYCTAAPYSLTAPAGYSSYLWSTGATTQGISIPGAGNFTVLVQSPSTGCYLTDTAHVQVGTVTPPNLGPNQVACPGANVSLNAGAGYASYFWSTGANTQSITATVPGTVMVTVSSALGCQAADTVVLSALPVNPVAVSGPQNICPGAAATYTASPGFSSYVWSNFSSSPTIIVNSPGTYSVTAMDANGCTTSSSVTLGLYPQPSVNLGPNITLIQGNSATLDAGNGFQSFLWSTGATTQTITVTTAGTYWVQATDANGCTATDTVTVSVITAVMGGSAYQMELSPVPADARLRIHLHLPAQECIELRLMDMMGRRVWEYVTDCQQETTIEVDLRQLASGAYLLHAIGERGMAIRRVEVVH